MSATDESTWARAFRAVDAARDPAKLADYLDLSARTMLAEPKRQALALLGLRPGHRALDVGCGTGDDVRAMAHAVGPSGLAAGLDSSAAMIDEARARAKAEQLTVDFRVGDAHRLPFSADSFDAVRVERTLQHVRDPRAVIREMIRVARPGAMLTASEPDWDTLVVDMQPLEVTRAICRCFADELRQPDIGRRLRGLFLHAGAEEVRVGSSAPTIVDFALAEALMQISLFAERVSKAGVVSAREARSWVDGLRGRGENDRFFATVSGFIVVARAPEM